MPPARAAAADEAHLSWLLPELFLEFLAIAITKSLLPERLNAFFGDNVYVWLGAGETAKGFLAFLACRMMGRPTDYSCIWPIKIIGAR